MNANQLNVLAEFIGGYMFAGKPLANMIFKILSEDVVGQGIYFAQDMKLGHYLKVPPRTLFFAQGLATILGALTQCGVTLWMLGNVKDICTEDQNDGFSCPNGRTVFSSSVIWGAIGPARLYSAGKIYSSLLHFFWIGALMPVVTWLVYKRTKIDFFKFINWPLIFVGTYNVPPATGINYSSWALVNFIFNRWVFRRYFPWWTKYNYVLAAALDTGLAISGIIIFFCITYPGGVFPDWWGKASVPFLYLIHAGLLALRLHRYIFLTSFFKQVILCGRTLRMDWACHGSRCPRRVTLDQVQGSSAEVRVPDFDTPSAAKRSQLCCSRDMNRESNLWYEALAQTLLLPCTRVPRSFLLNESG